MIEGSLVHCLALEPQNLWGKFVLNDCKVKPSSANQSLFCDAIIKNKIENAKRELDGEPTVELDLAELYASCYKVTSKDDPAKLAEDLAGKLAEFIEYKVGVNGRMEVTHDNLQAATMLHDALMNSAAGKYFDPEDRQGESEVALKWQYAGINFRGSVDRRHLSGNGVILDLKKTTDASPKKFGWTVKDMHYDEQVELYRIGGEMPDARGLLIALEPPFHVSINEIHPVALRAARRKIDFYISEFKRCILEDAWWQSYGFYSQMSEENDALLPTSFIYR